MSARTAGLQPDLVQAQDVFVAVRVGHFGHLVEHVDEALEFLRQLEKDRRERLAAQLDSTNIDANFYAGYGVSSERFLAAMADPGVDAQMRQAASVARAWEVEGTPALVVAGRYRVLGRTFEDALRITDWLVARERQAISTP